MLDFLPKFAEALLSNNFALLPPITTALPMAANRPRVATQDPSTLALAIVGIVTLAVYYAATGWRKPRPKLDRSNRAPATGRTDEPKRDAA